MDSTNIKWPEPGEPFTEETTPAVASKRIPRTKPAPAEQPTAAPVAWPTAAEPISEDETTGVEDVAYDVQSGKGMPGKPRTAQETVKNALEPRPPKPAKVYPAYYPEVDDDDEPTGVENVRADRGMPQNPTTPEQARVRVFRSALPGFVSSPRTNPPPQDIVVKTDSFGGRSGSGVGIDPDNFSGSNYQELIDYLEQQMDGVKPLTPEEVEKLKRRQRTEGIISGISDAARAVSNLFFTTEYAPDMYNHQEGMTAKAKERFDKAKAQRDADNDRYLNFALQLGKARDAQAQMQFAKDRAAQDAERHGWDKDRQPHLNKKAEEDARAAGHRANIAATQDEYEPLRQKSGLAKRAAELETERAKKANYESSSLKNKEAAASYGRQNPKEYFAWGSDGKRYRFSDKKAADTFAKQNGTWVEVDTEEKSEEISVDERNKKKTTTTTKSKKDGYPAPPTPDDNIAPYRRSSNTPPSRRNNVKPPYKP